MVNQITPLTPLSILYTNVPNITPFVFREAPTYLSIQADVTEWLGDELVPWIFQNVNGLNDSWISNTNELITSWNVTTTELMEKVDDAVAGVGDSVELAQAAQAAAEAARDLAQQYASEAAGVQDEAITTLFTDTASAFRMAADAVYAPLSDVENIQAILDGRLSVATLEGRFDSKADLTVVTAGFDNIADQIVQLNLDVGEKADASVQTTVESGRLSAGIIDQRFAEARSAAVPIHLGGFRGDARFDALRNAIINPRTTKYRAVVLGSSSSNGAYVTKPEKAMFARLACLAGSLAYNSLDAVSVPDTSTDSRWWTGSQGNTTSQNYFPTARRDALARVVPDIVFHMIGENDFFYGTTIAAYKAALESSASFIETVNPQAINVFIHSHGRNDVPNPVAPWTAYRDTLKEIVAAKPDTRYFIDVMEYMYPLGTMDSNLGGMLMDSVHPGDAGHRYIARIIGEHVGIPDPDNFYKSQTWEFPLPAGSSALSGIAVLAELYIGAVNFPREAIFNGALWVTASSGGAYMQTEFYESTTVKRAFAHQIGAGARSIELSDRFYIPPRVAPRLILRSFADTGTNTWQGAGSGSTTLANASATLTAI